MYKIKEFSQYKKIISENKRKCINLQTNCLMLADSIKHYLEEERLYYEEYADGLIIYVDEMRYYTAYYFWEKECPFPDFSTEKKICIEEVDVKNRREDDLKILSSKLAQKGFAAKAVNNEIVMDLKLHKETLLEQVNRDLQELEKQGLRFTFCQERHIEQVISLWENALVPTDLPYDHLKFWKCEAAKVLCIVNKDDVVCCVTWWRDDKGTREGRHIVTNPLFYRRGLGSIMLHAWLADAAKCDLLKARSWVAADNIKSDAMHKKAGFIYSGKTCVQYILNSVS